VLRLRVDGDLDLPACRLVARPPLPRPLQRVVVNGRPVTTFAPDSVEISELPADVLLQYEPDDELPASEAAVHPVNAAGGEPTLAATLGGIGSQETLTSLRHTN
jgi:hypothetical protein